MRSISSNLNFIGEKIGAQVVKSIAEAHIGSGRTGFRVHALHHWVMQLPLPKERVGQQYL